MSRHRVGVAVLAAALLATLVFRAEEHEDRHPAHRDDPWRHASAALAYLEESDGRGWQLARSLEEGEQWLTVHTRSRRGELSLRFSAHVHSTSAEILAILREFDLIPTWNHFCDGASLLHLHHRTEMWAAAGVQLPWPIPKQYLYVRANVRKDPALAGALVATAQSFTPHVIEPPAGTPLPSYASTREHLVVDLAVARLQPMPRERRQPPLTRGDIYVHFDLSRFGMFTAASHPPGWLVNVIVWICVPSVWAEYLRALEQMRAAGSPHRARIEKDATGLYAWIARVTGQPLSSRTHRAGRGPTG